MNDSLKSQNSLTARQIDDLLQTMQELARLIDPLTTLLASTQTVPGAVGQRLEELMGRLSSVASGLELVVSQMLEMFSTSGAIGQIPTRLQTFIRTPI